MSRFRTVIPVILGPTCSGKTSLAVELARRFDPPAEIVSCDSMQVYRGLDAGTAKPTPAERAAAPHHLVDILDIHERCDAYRFVQLAESAIREIEGRGRRVIVAGGTGLYAKALVYNLALLPSDESVFANVLAQGKTPEGILELTREASARDTAEAERLAVNPRRLMRAVEVLRLTGRLPCELRNAQKDAPPSADPAFRQTVLMPEPEAHRRRIEQRAHAMVRGGWLEEVRALQARGLDSTPTARQALGYPEVAEFLAGHPGEVSETELDTLADRIALKTWQFARRQRTWFRHQHPGAELIHEPFLSSRVSPLR